MRNGIFMGVSILRCYCRREFEMDNRFASFNAICPPDDPESPCLLFLATGMFTPAGWNTDLLSIREFQNKCLKSALKELLTEDLCFMFISSTKPKGLYLRGRNLIFQLRYIFEWMQNVFVGNFRDHSGYLKRSNTIHFYSIWHFKVNTQR